METNQNDYKKYKVCGFRVISFTIYHMSLSRIPYFIEAGLEISLDVSGIKSRYILTHLNEYLNMFFEDIIKEKDYSYSLFVHYLGF